MRFKAPMIKELALFYDETVIANNKKDAIRNVQLFNPKSKVLEATWVYK